jgi:GNAT superfamily N-acetyltransferase
VAGALDLRRARYDHPDARALTELVQQYYVEIYGGPDEDPLTAELMWPPNGGFVLGYLHHRPVAMGGWLWAPSHGVFTSQLRRMYVEPSARRRGIGEKLLSALEADAHEHGAHRMILSTGRPQTAAIGLYRASGYVDIAPFGHYRDSDGAVHLGRELSRPIHRS